MTPEEIQQAREHAQAALAYRPIYLKPATENELMFARAVLALTEQQTDPDAWEGDVMSPATQQFLTGPQPEPVSQIDLRDELTSLAGNEIDRTWPDRVYAAVSISRVLLFHYTITRKPQGDPDV